MSARPAAAAVRPWLRACLPSVAETWVCEISLRSIGRAPMRRLSARSWACWMVPMFSIEAPVRPSMPSGLSWKSIVASETIWLSSVIAKRWKKSSGGAPAGTFGQSGETPASVWQSRPLSARRFVTRCEGLAALVRELHRHERRLRVRIEVLLGVLDLLTVELRVVLDHEEALYALRLVRRRLGLQDHDALGHLDDARAVRRAGRAEGVELRLALRVLRVLVRRTRRGVVVGQQVLAVRGRVVLALAERLLVGADRQAVRAEQVVLVAGGVVLLVGLFRRQVRARRHVVLLGLRLLLRSHLGGLVERLGARVRGVRPAVAEYVRLPVVELELRRRAHLVDGALRVLHVRQADRDLVAAGALDLGLGDAQGVGALADRVERVVERLRGDRRDLRRRLALVDELGAALQVKAQARGLRRDHEAGRCQQQQHDPEDREVPGPVGHRGVSTRRRPPSSSYAGKMSAFAGSGRSPSACTTTGLSSTRTPHSSAVAM